MQRLELVHQWLAGLFPGRPLTIAPASADASFRRYFRVSFDDGSSRIVMDAPPEHEDCRPFVKVAGLLHGAGVHAPEILAQDLARGLLLLSDLGSTAYIDALNDGNADALFRDALDALVKWQLASRPDALPPYDEALLRRELGLFPEWYVARHLGTPLATEQQAALEGVQATLLRNLLAQPCVFVHRDYMPRNLMVCEDNPGVLDFQDAVYGPISYDVISLFRDAFLGWEEERIIDWSVRYWEKARRAGLPVEGDFGDFYRNLEWMGLQRHLKVLGIFARLNYRDGKPKYLADTPRFVGYVRHVATRYAPLAPLARLLDELELRAPQVGYTF
ncbi:MAG: phosphotransferase [Burkholderiales bacterium]|jgi:aminoglycoside/choline kinase family phosphotransferase|nr:phosphotransferase [Zoogloeaceae bacterium]MBP9653969.1 phosphotransferase [Rhodocyclaceae bacterium]MCZ2173542.1 phosphotransferase [Burkholderiales bacterium]OQY66621.1 MAG: aminoglycoside phosphotransferase [Rhodocyclaceae bacterium UTPRO2]HNQ58410.1 phosphotransferase [Candidatus Desulfobacillus denitrificans]